MTNTAQPALQQKRLHLFLVLASPVLVVVIGHVAARFFYSQWGDWAWLGSSIVYWGSMALIVWFLGDRTAQTRWFGKSHGSKWM